MITLNTNQLPTASYTISGSFSGSFQGDGSGLSGLSSSTNTGSLLVTASVSSNVITFTKGNGATFPITVSTGSGTTISTGSFVTTSSFNSFTSSYNTGSFSGSLTGSLFGIASTASFYQEIDPIFIAKSASLATTGSNNFNGNQTITGSIIFNSGSRITSTYYGNAYPGYIDIVAGAPGGFVELLSYNQSSSVNVDDYSVYITTNSSSQFNLWEFKRDGRLLAPRGIEATSFTGSLLGTASYATTASYAMNGGSGGGSGVIYVLDEGVNQGSASYFNFVGAGVTATVTSGTASLSIPGTIITGSNAILVQAIAATTWSFYHNLGEQYPVFTIFDSNNDVMMPARINAVNTATASIYFSTPTSGRAVAANCGLSGSTLYATASYAYTASYALTASYATTFTIGNTLNTTYTVTSSIVGANNLFTQATGSYTSAFFKYTVSNGANARAGEVMTVWNGGTTTYTDTSTTDIGDTSAVTCSAAIVSNNIQFNIYTGTSGWKLKSLATYM
jgi:hypothetical protein